MPSYKFTVRYQGHGFGPSESWYTGDLPIADAVSKIQAYLDFRAGMLFSDCEIAGVQIGRTTYTTAPQDPGDPARNSQFYPGGNVYNFERSGSQLRVPGPGLYTPSSPALKEAFANVAIHERLTFDTSRSTTRYFVWPPYSTIRSDKSGGLLSYEPNWVKLYNRFENWLRGAPDAGDPPGGLYIKATTAQSPTSTFPIRGWRSFDASPGLIGFVLDTASAGEFTRGRKVHVRGVRRKPPPSVGGAVKLISINGNWFIDSVTASSPATGFTTIFLRGTEGIDPTTIKILGTAQVVQVRLFQVQNAQQIRIRTHKRGKDTTVPRGRRLTRVTADP